MQEIMPDTMQKTIQKLFIEDSSWYNAITLSERIALLKKLQSERNLSKCDKDIAHKKIQRWKSQSCFKSESSFSQRLKTDGITEEEFFYLLGESTDTVKKYFSDVPVWLMELAQVFINHNYDNFNTFINAEQLTTQKEPSFLLTVQPLINQGISRLNEFIQTLINTKSHLPFEPSSIVELLLINLKKQLFWVLNRTMILELNVARLQGLLQGETPQERFQHFIQRLQQPEVLISLFQEYPVLARQLVLTIDHWVNFSQEFIQHLCDDWDTISSTFSSTFDFDNEPCVLTEISASAGDAHCRGRAVLIAKFSSGFQIVYKPKPLSVDVHFQQLLEWLNQRGNHPPFRTLKIINKGDYGWVEFVVAHGCTHSEEIQRFYERQGAYLCLLYSLEATDFHNENLIAAGEHPVLIDLESLFHPRVESMDEQKRDILALKTIDYSVLRVGLLPQRFWANGEYEGIEISGLGGKEGQLTPTPVQYLSGVGTDEMRIARERKPISVGKNRPTLNDAPVNILEYTEALVTGFSKMYRLLLEHRDELLSSNSPLACFAEDKVRFILRPTQLYGLLLNESFHPDLLRNALERDRFFDKLWLDIEQYPYMERVVVAERNDLWQGDIPMFSTYPNSRDIWTSSGERITNFFENSGMSLVQNHLQRLSEADLTQQLWFIRASFTTFATVGEQGQWPSYDLTEPKSIASYEQILKAAQAVGDRLESLALRNEQNASWIGLMLLNQKHSVLTPLGMELYHGLPGMILFLAYLGSVTKQERYTKLAKAALNNLRNQVEISKTSLSLIGAFEGWGGIIYTFTHLGVLWGEPKLLDEAESLVDLLPSLIEKDEKLDIIAGAAGCLTCLINLYNCRPGEQTLAAAIQCAEQIISHLKPTEQSTNNISWQFKDTTNKPLAGFSHGAAGIASALLELASLTGESRFRTTALAAIEYERSIFCPEVQNWPDLRYFSAAVSDLQYFPNAILSKNKEQYICLTAWCHGAPGIGLARLRSLPHLDDAKIREEIKTTLRTTLSHGFGFNHSLCHGDLGNLELLLQASLTLNEPLNEQQLKSQIDRFTAIILESIDKHGWLCGVPLGVETPGLMTGLAGIGYGLLRLAAPELVPSVLTLESPKTR